MSKVIQKHIADLRRERMTKAKQIGGSYARDPMKLRDRFGKETSTMSNALSEMDKYVRTARMQSNNNGFGSGGWTVSKKVPRKPYEPNLKDVYPRNEYTMMPSQNGPKYYSGNFLTYDYKDTPQTANDDPTDDGRPVVFKTRSIERVQTKKKYGENLKGQSSVPLHLCNDTTSLLYQRSLQPDTRDRSHLQSRAATELSEMRSVVSRYPYALHHAVKNDSHDTTTTQTWVNSTYPTGRRARDRISTGSTSVFDVPDRKVGLGGNDLRSGRIQTAPEWYSDFFPRKKVADALKFMGSPKSQNQPGRGATWSLTRVLTSILCRRLTTFPQQEWKNNDNQKYL